MQALTETVQEEIKDENDALIVRTYSNKANQNSSAGGTTTVIASEGGEEAKQEIEQVDERH